MSRTSIQEDFYRQMRELKLEKYRDVSAQDLSLDLRRKADFSEAALLFSRRSRERSCADTSRYFSSFGSRICR